MRPRLSEPAAQLPEDGNKQPRLTGRERTSIIILACNGEKLTHLCLESILRHTSGDFELIPVDNGSTDGIPMLFAKMKSMSEPRKS